MSRITLTFPLQRGSTICSTSSHKYQSISRINTAHQASFPCLIRLPLEILFTVKPVGSQLCPLFSFPSKNYFNYVDNKPPCLFQRHYFLSIGVQFTPTVPGIGPTKITSTAPGNGRVNNTYFNE